MSDNPLNQRQRTCYLEAQAAVRWLLAGDVQTSVQVIRDSEDQGQLAVGLTAMVASLLSEVMPDPADQARALDGWVEMVLGDEGP